MNKLKMTLNSDNMEDYFQEFDVVRHKYFRGFRGEISDELQKKIRNMAEQSGNKIFWSVQNAVETYRTLDKVYDWEEEQMHRQCGLLQKVTEELLGDYVGIDGIQDLFRPTYFQFEWMMHLEYMEKEHSYSYYRDHYMHQIRNLYEMFILMDDFGMWKECMRIYRRRNGSVARRIKDSIHLQIKQLKKSERKALKKACRFVEDEIEKDKQETYGIEEFFYRELFFSTVIVSALVHDVAYPLVYMERTLGRMRHFLPLSNWFMGIENAIPRVHSLLKDSLLFEVAGSEEIENRLNKNDHGTYSAIVLLIQYYDNGHIYKLDPLKRMVIELSALVIYNHTLRYHFQEKENERYDNVYEENPISFLFRLCDDLQEWDRVYFEINDQGNLFICNSCKMPMIRNLQDEETVKGKVKYTCFCGDTGTNTNLFKYRKMMNVSPFKELTIAKEEKLWHFTMDCDLGALLQMAKYNPVFAIQRIKGINEIVNMVDEQRELLPVYMETFISNNPFAIKAAILYKYYTLKVKRDKYNFEDIEEGICASLDRRREWTEYFERIRKKIETSQMLFNLFIKKIEGVYFNESREIIRKSVRFYTFLVVLGNKLKKRREEIVDKLTKNEEDLRSALVSFFEKVADLVADEWQISDVCSRVLIANALQGMFCEIDKEEFENYRFTKLFELYKLRFQGRRDMAQLVSAYTKKDMYNKICTARKREMKNGELLFDFYSDYYFYFSLADDIDKAYKASVS